MSKINELCTQCGEDYIYSETLTNCLCLNCYQNNQDELILCEIEARLDNMEA